VISLSKGEVVSALGGHAEGESVEAVQFVELAGTGGVSGVAVTGGTDGKACIWDLSTMRLRATLDHQVLQYIISNFLHCLTLSFLSPGCCDVSPRPSLS